MEIGKNDDTIKTYFCMLMFHKPSMFLPNDTFLIRVNIIPFSFETWTLHRIFWKTNWTQFIENGLIYNTAENLIYLFNFSEV